MFKNLLAFVTCRHLGHKWKYDSKFMPTKKHCCRCGQVEMIASNLNRLRAFAGILLLMVLLTGGKAHSQITLAYAGYNAGANVVAITNSLTCTAEVRVAFTKAGLPRDTTVTVPAGSTIYVSLPGEYNPGAEIKIKADGACSTSGWLGIVVPSVLALRDPVPFIRPSQNPPANKVWVIDLNAHYMQVMDQKSYRLLLHGRVGRYLIVLPDGTKRIWPQPIQ